MVVLDPVITVHPDEIFECLVKMSQVMQSLVVL